MGGSLLASAYGSLGHETRPESVPGVPTRLSVLTGDIHEENQRIKAGTDYLAGFCGGLAAAALVRFKSRAVQ